MREPSTDAASSPAAQPPEGAWTRRRFLCAAGAAGMGLCLGGAAAGPRAVSRAVPEAIRIGYVGLRTPGTAAGAAGRAGAEMAGQEAAYNAGLFDSELTFTAERADGPEAALETFRTLLGDHDILVSGVEDPIVQQMGDLAEQEGRLFLNAGSTLDALRGAACHRTSFHVEASASMYVDAIAQWLGREGGPRRWFFVQPETPQGEALAARAQERMQALGAEAVGTYRAAPDQETFADAFRAARQAEADVAFVTLTGPAQVAFTEQYRWLAPPFEVAGPLPAMHRMEAAGGRAAAGAWPVMWHHGLFKYGADQIDERFREASGRRFDGPAWTTWAAITLAADAALKAGSTALDALVPYLEDELGFDSRKGAPLTFRPWNHQARQVLYIVQPKPQPNGPQDLFEVAAEVPAAVPGDYDSTDAALDQLGVAQAESDCRL